MRGEGNVKRSEGGGKSGGKGIEARVLVGEGGERLGGVQEDSRD